ncbi:unnamed protein product [Kuraishia capsulata CBS 1993]|uniref:Zinc/iron permease n=1 Tax=Kuraishia capsulata CBS 1993 TaxID=1382522 RepID=W6MLM6_9ASCO|nr:uncharacterized protein KUCA_T00003397001 [Kuraishia capsulata CBS 1993]CDK27419.1 unnamed protein product [Kuraishia capsulata CBS 1993]
MYISEGWLLVILSSLITVLGCLVISLDVLYAKLLPSYSKAHPFTISDNSSFLINSLALSGGCLLFTSMYKLLPSGQDYFERVPALVEGKHSLMAHVMGFYLLGILLSAGLNTFVHFMTSESIVHCVHGDAHHHDHEHNHGDHQDLEARLGASRDSPETHEHHPRSHSESHSPGHSHSHSHSHSDSHVDEEPHSHSHSHQGKISVPTEIDPLLPGSLERRESIFDRSLRALRGSKLAGKCYGYNSIESCHLPNGVCVCKQHTFEDVHNEEVPVQIETTKALHYTELPQSENHLFFTASKLIRSSSVISLTHPNMTVKSPLITNEPPISEARSLSPDEATYKGDEADRDDEEEDHHHHITTPLSRLLSIGLQTVLALTLHKFPEGFIVYSTSNADEQTGLSIFLSMFIHNFVEGFTMALPLYIALDSRVKAILIVGLLGGLAQPVGALCSYLIFRGKFLNLDDPKNLMIFGSLMCVTSGFLTIIGFQMLSSSIAFGGSQSKVLTWACLGISLIGLSYVLMSDE